MGLSSSKTKTKNEPWAPAQKYILQGLDNSGRVFDQQQPKMEAFSGMQMDTYGRLAPGAEAGILATQNSVNNWASGANRGQSPGNGVYGRMTGFTNAAIPGASDIAAGGFVGQGEGADYWRKALNGDFLGGNPHLEGVIGKTTRGVSDAVSRRFGASGVGFGKSTAHTDVLSRNLAEAENSLRYQDYATERGYQDRAAGLLDGATRADRAQRIQGLGLLGEMSGADASRQMQAASALDANYNADIAREQDAWGTSQDLMRGSQSLLNNAAELPWMGVGALNGNVRQASAGYGTTTTKTSPSAIQAMGQFGDALGSLSSGIGSAAGTAMMLSDARAKDIKGKVGETPDGLGVYDFTYKPEIDPAQTPQTGVLAQEVAAKRPDALGPTTPEGLFTVDYGALKQDVPTIERPKLGLLGELQVDPTLSHPAAAKKRLGAFLAAASGNPLGQAVLAMGTDARRAKEDALDADYRSAQAEYYRKRADGAGGAAETPRAPRIIQLRDGSVISVDPVTMERTEISPPITGGSSEPVMTIAGADGAPVIVPRSQAIGKRPYVKPPAARSGRAAAPAKVQATRSVGGKAYYKINGAWFDNPEGR